jgi:hypothetical protein
VTDTVLAVLRPDDLLVLDIELVNLRPSGDGAALVAEDPAAETFVIVHLPPQAIAEAVWISTMEAPPPIRTVLAGPSRLAFRIPPGTVVPLTVEGLTRWEAWEPVLAPTALPRDTPPSAAVPVPAPPTARETAIELPWRLLLSPDARGRWRVPASVSAPDADADADADGSAKCQLWSAVLHAEGGADVRVLAERSGPRPPAFESSLDGLPSTRRQLVHLTSDFHMPVSSDAAAAPFTPVPLHARRLELTALGANAELEGGWSYPLLAPGQQPPGYQWLDLLEYQHTTALGRDHFVRTLTAGYLCGTGHRAVVEVTVERLPSRIEVVGKAPGGGALFGAKGYLLKTAQVIVQQPVVDYGSLAGAFAHGGRELPWRSIRLTTKSARIMAPPDWPFWLRDPDGEPLMFEAVGTDHAGNLTDLSLPLMFVQHAHLAEHGAIRGVFGDPPFADASVIELGGQSLAFAPPGDKPGSTVLRTERLRYDIEQPPEPGEPPPEHPLNGDAAPPWYLPRFLPRVAALSASVPAVEELLGVTQPQEMVPNPVFLRHGFDPAANRPQTFADFVTELPLKLPTQRGGGLASPDAAARALSRTLGPVAAPQQLQLGKVDLSAFAQTKLLGTIPLLDLLPVDLPFDAAATAAAPTQQQLDDPRFTVNPPRLTTRRLPAGAAVPDLVETRFTWKPPLRDRHEVSPVFTLGLDGADLLLDATTRLVRGGQPSAVVHGRLRKVRLTFAGALSVEIGSLSFRGEGGRKIEVGAERVTIGFEGPLAFVRSLQSILPADGFDDGPSLTVDSQGAVAGYTLGLPNVGVGIFSLQGIALSAALSIPFTDRPAGVRFTISERHKPFLVTVSLFGGGGFFAIAVSARGLESVEASLEFGASVSLNLGVASGGVSVMAGIYFGMQAGSVELTGYLRCGGCLEVLGLISISLEFYLAFTYRKKAGGGSEVWGQASLTVSVKVAFFSTSVTLSVERRFAGSDGDPTFADSFGPAEYAGYLQAFA